MQSVPMESNWAAEHLQVIRTLMERSAIYRRALAPIMLGTGVLVLGASETANASADLFAPVDRKHRLYAKRPTAAPAVLGFGRSPATGPPGSGGRLAAAKRAAAPGSASSSPPWPK